MNARGRVVVVTGASAGIGRATARELAARGARLGLVARGSAGLDAARREVEREGVAALALAADVSSWEEVDAAASEIERALGPIDVWVNCAMVSVFARAIDTDPADTRRVTEVDYLGYVHGTVAALRRMVPRDAGTIVQVGSALAYRAIPLQAAYCAAKHAVKGFTESVRTELLHDGSNVRVTQVHLPAVNTPQFHWVKTSFRKHPQPVPPIYQPEVAARAIAHAAWHPRREWWVGGPTVATILLNRIVPGLLDRYLARTAHRSQQADFPTEPGRRHNLYEPFPEDLGAHGEFDERSHPRSVQSWLARHRTALPVGGAVIAAIAGGLRRRDAGE